MAEKATGARAPDDAELLNRVRTGDATAFGVLYHRHVTAVRRLARELVESPAEADHLVAETFALVHDVTQRGGGPTDAFRPYVLAALRRVAADQVRDWRVPAAGHPDPGEPLATPGQDGSPVVRAFLSLPERWRAVLWHTDIEEEPAAEIAPLLGVSAAGVAELRSSARAGLRQAVVRAYIAGPASPGCQPTAERLDEYQRGALAAEEAAAVGRHLEQCADCTAICVALGGITAGLRNQVAPVFLGPAATRYLLGSREAVAAVAGAPPPAASAIAAGGAAGVFQKLDQLPRRARVGVAVLVAACAVAAGAIVAKGTAAGRGPSRPVADGQASLDIKATPTPTPVASPTSVPTPAPRPTHHRIRHPAPRRSTVLAAQPPPAPTTAPPPQPTATPAAAPQLSASVSVSGGRHFFSASFQVTNTGNAATGSLTATITLPSGSMFGGAPRQGSGTAITTD